MLVPTVVESTDRGERAYDIYSRLLGERIVFLGSAIDDAVANLVIAQLIHLEAADPEREYVEVVMPQKLRYAAQYVDEASIATDLRIIGLTLKTLVSG